MRLCQGYLLNFDQHGTDTIPTKNADSETRHGMDTKQFQTYAHDKFPYQEHVTLAAKLCSEYASGSGVVSSVAADSHPHGINRMEIVGWKGCECVSNPDVIWNHSQSG